MTVVHVSGPVPERVRSELEESFTVVDSPDGADGVLSLITTTVDAAYLDRAGPQLRIVANYGVGVNNIDLKATAARNVVVANTPDVLTDTTAELAIALTLSLLRRVGEGDRLLRRREPWEFSLEFMLGESLRGKTFGVVGPGRIGHATGKLAEAFGANVRFAGRGDDVRELLRESDVVSLHVALTPETHHLIDEAADLMEEVIVLHEGEIVLQADVDDARSSAYVARGLADEVRAFAAGRDVIAERSLGRILSATIRGQVTADDEDKAAAHRISIEPVSLQDLIAALGIHTLTSALTTENL